MMDRYSFEHGSKKWIATNGNVFALSQPFSQEEMLRAACAEILRLAEEIGRRQSVDAVNSRLIAANEQLAEENQTLKGNLEDVDGLKEEARGDLDQAQEIIGELSAGLAVLAGESLRDCAPSCPGHLGPKATEAVDHALTAWRALEEGNRAAAERIEALEKQVRGLEADVDIARSRAEQAERRAEDMLDAEAALSAAIDESNETNARLGRELCAILQDHVTAGADGRGEGAVDVLRRIIRERTDFAVERDGYRSNLKSVLAANEAIERENREKCLELAEKAGQIRELEEATTELHMRLDYVRAGAERDRRLWGKAIQARDAATKAARELRHRLGAQPRTSRLLALLDSEEPPFGALTGVPPAHAHAAQALWRWLREQVAPPGLSGDDLS